jgi:hypothetical protein
MGREMHTKLEWRKPEGERSFGRISIVGRAILK